MSKRVVMLVALILAWASALHAQASGAIRGHVQLPDSTPAAGARVALRGTTYLTTADSAGDFDIDSVVPGPYLVVATREGQNPGTVPTRVVAGETVMVRVTLGGPVQLQEITVQASRGYVARDASTGTKSDTPILETPLSIQVVSQEVLQDQKATTLGASPDECQRSHIEQQLRASGVYLAAGLPDINHLPEWFQNR